MKQLLLILSGILFFCSCSSDYEKIAQGKLKKLNGNIATIESCNSDFSESENPKIIDLANNKDIILNTDLQVGQEVFVYTKNNQIFLSQLSQEEIEELTSSSIPFITLSICIGIILLVAIWSIITEWNISTVTARIISIFILLTYLGMNYFISRTTPEQYIIRDYGNMLFYANGVAILQDDTNNITYYKDVIVSPRLKKANIKYKCVLISQGNSIQNQLLPCNNLERIKKTIPIAYEKSIERNALQKKILIFISIIFSLLMGCSTYILTKMSYQQ